MSEIKPKVVILGAGISGLSCAVNLIDHCDVTILEARSRIGGRVHTRRFEDNFLYEDGSQWVNCGKGDDLELFAEKHMIGTSPYQTKKRFLFESHEAKGDEYKRIDEVLQSFDSQVEDATKGINVNNSNNLMSYINDNWSYSKNKEFSQLYGSMLQFQSVKEGCSDLKTVNVKDYGNFNSDKGLATTFQTVNGGTDAILNKLIELLPEDAVKCNKKVTNVKWSGTNVRTTVEDLETGASSFFDADFVVSTLPLGVLKDVHEKMFEPRLPAEKADAIKRVGFGSVATVTLRFKCEDIIGSEGKTMLYLLRKDEFKYGNYSVIVFRSPGNNEQFMTIWLVGKEAELAERTEDDVLIEEFGADLKKIHAVSTLPIRRLRDQVLAGRVRKRCFPLHKLPEHDQGHRSPGGPGVPHHSRWRLPAENFVRRRFYQRDSVPTSERGV